MTEVVSRHSAACSTMRPLRSSFSPPLRGRCRRQRGGSPSRGPSGRWRRTPPLSLRDISPRKGGRGDLRVLQRSPRGGKRGTELYCVFLELNQADRADRLVEAERGQLVPGRLCSTEPVLS